MTALCDTQDETAPAPTVAARQEIIAKRTPAGDYVTTQLPTRIVLTGFMGAGKSTVGPLLAAQLKWSFLDVDVAIAQKADKAVHEIFEQDGEFAFRRMETSAIAHALGSPTTVIALGGGAVEVLANRLLLEQTPRTAVVLLEAPLPDLLRRCHNVGNAHLRPNLARAEERFAYRQPLYRRVARLRVQTEASTPEETRDRVLAQLGFLA